MQPSTLARYRRWISSPPPLVGPLLYRWAVSALISDSTPKSIATLAGTVLTRADSLLHQRVRDYLGTLAHQAGIDAVCGVWAETRDPTITSLLEEKSWIAEAPASVKVLTALRAGRVDMMIEATPGLLGPLLNACTDVDAGIAARAREALSALKNPATIDALCARWRERREPLLDELVAAGKFIARKPPAVRVLTALKAAAIDTAATGGAELIEPLVTACDDSDRVIADGAVEALKALRSAEARDAFCRRILVNENPRFREICVAKRFAPTDPAQRAVFFFLTEQWERYEELDFDQSLLRGAYEAGDQKLRGRITERIRRSGRSEWITVIGASRQEKQLGAMTAAEWSAALAILSDSQRWTEMWQLAQFSPPIWSVRLLQRLAIAGWLPDDESRDAFERLRGLATNLPASGDSVEVPPDIARPGRLTTCRSVLEGHTGQIAVLAISPDGTRIATGGNDHLVCVWKAEDGTLLHTLRGHTDWVSCIAWNHSGELLATGSRDQTVRLWKLDKNSTHTNLAGHTDNVRALLFTNDDRLLVSASDDGSIRLWQARDGQLLSTLKGHSDSVSCLAQSRSGLVLASGGYDKRVCLWSLPEATAIANLSGHRGIVNTIAFSADDQLLASGGKDRSVLLWRVADGAKLNQLKGHKDDVCCLALHPAGTILASGSWDTTIRLWSLPEGELIELLGATATMGGHTGWITAMAFSPDGGTLISGSIDNTVRLWNVANGAQIAALEAHEERVTAIGVTPDGQTIASASWDGKARLWRSELARLCLLPAVQSTLQDLDWAIDASGDGRLSAQERTWLEFLVTLMRWRRRHDIAIADTSHFEVGEFDITIESR